MNITEQKNPPRNANGRPQKIKYTLKYTQLVNFPDDDYICKVARKPKGIKELIEAGFEYVTDQDGLKFFRKRK